MEQEKKLKPYDRVLVRSIQGEWTATTFSHYRDSEQFPYSTSYGQVSHCIPYEGNEHLVGTNGVPTETPKPKERWRANIGEVYYYLTMNNDVFVEQTWEENYRNFTNLFANEHYQMGNYFRTREEAEAMRVKIKELLKGK